ncbi:hypothetical protein GCM10009731_54210 [Streptomyces globosus]
MRGADGFLEAATEAVLEGSAEGCALAEADGTVDAVAETSGEPLAGSAPTGSASAGSASADCRAADGSAAPAGWEDGPHAARSPAASTAAATADSRLPRTGAGRAEAVRRSARTDRSMREVMAKSPQGTVGLRKGRTPSGAVEAAAGPGRDGMPRRLRPLC